MWNALLERGERPRPVLTAPLGSAESPRNRKITRLIPSAGPAVQNMLRMCSPVVRPPPTSRGTRIVVSDSGVILSPKYAPQMTAPGGDLRGDAHAASPSRRTRRPSVPAVVHELPVTIPTIAQIAAVARKNTLGLSS